MNCPGCGADLVELPGDDQTLRKCGDCGGLWLDVSDLNRLLLHHNLPGIQALGGKLNAEVDGEQCPDCMVDMVQIEGGEKNNPIAYQTCESCGGVYLEADYQDCADQGEAIKRVIAFFEKYSGKKQKKRAAGG